MIKKALPCNKNYQVTLTFRKDVNKAEADATLLRALIELQQKCSEIVYEFYSEIGTKLRYHFHGYLQYKSTTHECYIKQFLFMWKRRNGFIYLSSGELPSWIVYIQKQREAPYCFRMDNGVVDKYTKGMQLLNAPDKTFEDYGFSEYMFVDD